MEIVLFSGLPLVDGPRFTAIQQCSENHCVVDLDLLRCGDPSSDVLVQNFSLFCAYHEAEVVASIGEPAVVILVKTVMMLIMIFILIIIMISIMMIKTIVIKVIIILITI